MPFRRDDLESDDRHHLPGDPLARFLELHSALEGERRWWQDGLPLRLAAVTLVTTPGEPAALAAAIRGCDRELQAALRWYSAVAPMRVIVSAQLVKYGETVEGFVAEVARLRELFRAAKLRRDEFHETLAVLILRRALATPAGEVEVARIAALYAEMRRHHWFLTGPEDLPACALLVGQPGTPEAVGAGIEAVYQALRHDARLSPGDRLQTAANVLYLSGLEPHEIAGRFAELRAAFRGAGIKIRSHEYDEIAILCFLAQPIPRIIATVVELRDQLRQSLTWSTKGMAFNLAANLAFVRLADAHDQLGALGDAKALLDMQAIVAAGGAVP